MRKLAVRWLDKGFASAPSTAVAAPVIQPAASMATENLQTIDILTCPKLIRANQMTEVGMQMNPPNSLSSGQMRVKRGVSRSLELRRFTAQMWHPNLLLSPTNCKGEGAVAV